VEQQAFQRPSRQWNSRHFKDHLDSGTAGISKTISTVEQQAFQRPSRQWDSRHFKDHLDSGTAGISKTIPRTP
jgi:hypothetical protein